MNRAGEVARFSEITRSPQKHGGVPVMAAAMHLALVPGAVAEGIGFLHVEGIHVRAQADRAAVVGLRALQCPHHAGAGQAAMHVVSELGELSGNEIGCAEFLERRFGMGVQIAAPGGHLIVKIGDPIDDGHDALRGGGLDMTSCSNDARARRSTAGRGRTCLPACIVASAIGRLPRDGPHPSMQTRHAKSSCAAGLVATTREAGPNRRVCNDRPFPQRPFPKTGSRDDGRRRGTSCAAGAHEFRAREASIRPTAAAAPDGILSRSDDGRGGPHLCPRARRDRHPDRSQAPGLRADSRQGLRAQGSRHRDDGLRFARRAAGSGLLPARHLQHRGQPSTRRITAIRNSTVSPRRNRKRPIRKSGRS